MRITWMWRSRRPETGCRPYVELHIRPELQTQSINVA